MKQVFHDLSTYSADLFGINSALYELGGLIVMHDASGCNSTYNTHDEPRWYTMNSMIYVSGLTEKDAILGNDKRVIEDMSLAAEREHPRFTAISVSVLPAYMGTDVRGIARLVEKRTGIPSFGFKTNGMDSYVPGASMAFRAIAERFCPGHLAGEYAEERRKRREADPGSGRGDMSLRVNLMGITPLDFSVNGNVQELEKTICGMGYQVQSNWAMGNTLDDLMTAPAADVSLVASASGLAAAEYLYDKFRVPYVIGFPCGKTAVREVRDLLRKASEEGMNMSLFEDARPDRGGVCEAARKLPFMPGARITIAGEAVHAASIRFYLERELGCTDVRILCPLEIDAGVLRDSDSRASGEEEIRAFLNEGSVVIADPVYNRVTKSDVLFIDDPHEAYSGRMYHSRGKIFTGTNPDLI